MTNTNPIQEQQSIQQRLIDCLQHLDNLVIDGTLNRNLVIESALKVEPKLIKTLLTDDIFKKHFFQEVENVLVFDKIKFQRFVSNKSFLPDSYTAFKNKIGLALADDTHDNYITTKNDVVLVWAHKDCVLEGGQTKEDQKRNEIFWNETLAPESIDRLLAPKALTNFKKYDKNGTSQVTEITEKDNFIIKGNNLLALSSLLKTHRGKIKLIYIDPPYNTGNDSFSYNDNFNHSSWLTFMKNRLEIARQLLREDGLIFIQCDDNEQAYLKVLLDEVFYRDNFGSHIVTRATPNARDYGLIAQMHEHILLYAKNIQIATTNLIEIENKSFNYEDSKGKFNIHPLYNSNVAFNIDNRRNLYYPFYLNPNKKDENGFYEICLEKDDNLIEVYPPKSIKDNVQFVWRWGVEKSKENINVEIVGHKTRDGEFRIIQKMRGTSQLARSIWDDTEFSNRRATEDLQKLFNKKVFSFPKPETLLSRIIEISTQENDIVLDYHLGSGTTCAVAHKMNRRYIGIEQMDYIETVAVERLKKVIDGEQGGISKSVNWQGGGSFIYTELKEKNQHFISQIQNAEDKNTLLAIWQRMEKNAVLYFGFDKKDFNERIEAFKTAPIEQMKQFLAEVLDKNHLYVNLSDLQDESINISEEEKALNQKFYKL